MNDYSLIAIMLVLSFGVIGTIIINFDANIEEHAKRDVTFCDKMNTHPEQFEFEKSQQDSFERCIGSFQDGTYFQYIDKLRQVSLIIKITPLIVFPTVFFILNIIYRKEIKENKYESTMFH